MRSHRVSNPRDGLDFSYPSAGPEKRMAELAFGRPARKLCFAITFQRGRRHRITGLDTLRVPLHCYVGY